MDKLTYGPWLRTERRRRGITQKAIDQETGISESHLSKIERGRIGMPDKKTRDRIHEILGTSDDDLVAVGLLTKSVIPDRDGGTRTIYFTPDGRSEEGFVRWNVTSRHAEDEPVPEQLDAIDAADAVIPAHMRASFLKTGNWSPERQKSLTELIDDLDLADQADREQRRKDRERREAEGVE